MNQEEMPFLQSLCKEKNRSLTSFHMPAHKRTQFGPSLLFDYYGSNLNEADLVEINGNIDYLHSPKAELLQAQQLAAQAYGVDETFFLINGSTVGNLAAIMSVVGQGEKLLVSRASHRSVYGGMIVSGCIPIYIQPEYDQQIQYPVAINVATVQRLLDEHPDIVAIHLTSPNYYGIVSDIETICQLAHQRNKIIIVDEAHGAHFHFHEKFPRSAIDCKADLIIHSTHKSQGSLTQSAMLHVNFNPNKSIQRNRLIQMLTLLQSSSPNSILLASLDAIRMQMSLHGHQLLSNVFDLSQQARHSIQQIDGLKCYDDQLIGQNHIFNYDPSKLIVSLAKLNLTGYEASYILRNQFHVEVEFCSIKHLIFSITIADTHSTIDKLIDALKCVSSSYQHDCQSSLDLISPPNDLPTMAMSLRDASFTSKTRSIDFDESVGYILCETIIPYPPGIPLLLPGEIIQQKHLDYIKYLIQHGASVIGLQDTTFKTIQILIQ